VEIWHKLIIINTVLLLIADYTYLFEFLGTDIVYISRTILRLAAMCALAFGGYVILNLHVF